MVLRMCSKALWGRALKCDLCGRVPPERNNHPEQTLDWSRPLSTSSRWYFRLTRGINMAEHKLTAGNCGDKQPLPQSCSRALRSYKLSLRADTLVWRALTQLSLYGRSFLIPQRCCLYAACRGAVPSAVRWYESAPSHGATYLIDDGCRGEGWQQPTPRDKCCR